MHFKIIELYLKCWKKKDIAKEVGVSVTTVSHTLRDPIAQKIINTMMKDSLKKSFLSFSK
jgi:predicted transcriptional regulator